MGREWGSGATAGRQTATGSDGGAADDLRRALETTVSVGRQRSGHVYEVVLDAILHGRIAPGSRLLIDEIAKALGVSITPVRDALYRLEGEGLVVRYPYQGWSVRAVSELEIRQLYEVRAGLEGFAAYLAASRIDAQNCERLRSIVREGAAALERGALEAYQRNNDEFHRVMVAAADNELLVNTMQQIMLQMQVLIAQTVRIPGRPDNAVAEHSDVVEAVAAGHARRAELLMRRHILAALKDVLKMRLANVDGPEAAKPLGRST